MIHVLVPPPTTVRSPCVDRYQHSLRLASLRITCATIHSDFHDLVAAEEICLLFNFITPEHSTFAQANMIILPPATASPPCSAAHQSLVHISLFVLSPPPLKFILMAFQISTFHNLPLAFQTRPPIFIFISDTHVYFALLSWRQLQTHLE